MLSFASFRENREGETNLEIVGRVSLHGVLQGGSFMSSDVLVSLSQRALNLLQEDADKIEKLIEVQMENLTTRKCPLYEEVLDTQIYGLSREIDFAIRADLINETAGKHILVKLERNLAELYEAMSQNKE